MKNILFFLAILTTYILNAQNQKSKIVAANNNGYNINIATQNLAGKTIKVSIYNGNYKQVFRIDSAIIKTNKETVSFRQKKRIIPLIYQISISGNPNKTDILIENGDQINFILNEDNIEKISTKHQLNHSFIELQKINSADEKNIALKNLSLKYKQNNALKYFTLFEIKKSLKNSSQEDGLVFRKKLLNEIDLNDKSIQLMPNTYAFLNNYFNAMPINHQNYKAGVDLLLAKQTCESPNFKFYIDWIFKNLELHQTQNINETAQYIFNQYVNNKVCIEKQKTFYDNIYNKLSTFTKLPVGAVLPDFEVKKNTNSVIKFSEIKKEKVNIIMFYDPSCEHCKIESPRIAKELEELEKSLGKNIGKFAFLNGTPSLWNDFIEKSNLKNWENITYKEGDQETKSILDAFANPKYYITDENGKILMKTYSYSFIRSQLLK